MKNPIAIFSSIAAVAAAALGTTLYVNRVPDAPQQIAASTAEPVAPAEPKVAEPKVAEPAAPAAEAPTQQQAAAEPAAPAAEAPAAPVAAAPAQPEAAAPAAPAEQPAATAEQPAAANTEVAVANPQPDAAPAVTPEPAPAVTPVPAPAATPLPAAAAPVLPAFDTVRVEVTGDAVIAGRAEPDSDVTVKWNGNVVGTTKANADGSFVLVPANPLKTGIGAMTIEMAKNGAVTVSEGSVFVVVKKDAPAMVAKVDPVAPTEVVQSGTPVDVPKDLQLTAVDYDAAGNIVFSGKAAPGTVVRFYVDNAPTGEGKANETGVWRFAGTSAVKPGTHTLRADAIDAEGKVQSRIELPFLREDAATVAAAQVAAAEPAAPAAQAVAVEPAAEPVTRSAVAEPAPAAPAAEPAAAETQVAATPEQPVAPAVQEAPRKIVIQPGNNLWKLSREVYGKGRMYTIIFEANRDLVKNPNKIYPGQILTAPKQP